MSSVKPYGRLDTRRTIECGVTEIGRCPTCKQGIFSNQEWVWVSRPITGKNHAWCVPEATEATEVGGRELIEVGVHDTARTASPRRKPRRKCTSCHRERTIVAHGKCTSCYHRSRHLGAVGNQTVQPSLLLSGDVIPWCGKRLSVSWVGLQLCEVSPKVRVRALELPDGPTQNLLFDCDDFVPVEVAHAC